MNISENDKRLLVIFTAFLLAFFYYTFFMKSSILQISKLSLENKNLMQNRSMLQGMQKSYDSDIDKEDSLQVEYANISKKLPPNLDEKFSILDAYNISNALGTELGDFTISKKEQVPFEREKNKIDKVYSYTLKLNWTLTYENFKKLFSYFDDFDTAYSISNLSAVPDKSGKVNTSFELKLYGFQDNDAPVRSWNNSVIPTGKKNIFLSDGKVGQTSSKVEDSIEYIDKNKDFLVLLSTLNSPTSAITLEKSNSGIDVFGGNKPVENIDITINGSGGRYTYAMSTEAGSYPKNGGFEKFAPESLDIIIHVASEPRKYADDKNIVIINVHNNTDKKVYVYITNDDKKLPRAAVVKYGPSIYVFNQ